MRTRKRCSNDKPWVNDKIRHLIRRRQRAFQSGDEALWKSLRNTIKRTIIHTKLTFTKCKLSQMNTTNPRSWFTTIKQIAGMDTKKGSISIPGHEKSTADELASRINNHFCTICSTLPSLNTAQLPAYLPSATPPPTITRSQA